MLHPFHRDPPPRGPDPIHPWTGEECHSDRMPRRYLGKCKACGKARGVVLSQRKFIPKEGASYETEAGEVYKQHPAHQVPCTRCACGSAIVLRQVRGTFKADKPCSPKCQAATGPQCECQCAGRNHGGAHF